MRPDGRTRLSADLVLRNIGIAVICGDDPAIRSVTPAQLSRILGISRFTIRDARRATHLMTSVFAQAPADDEPESEASQRADRNSRRRRTKPRKTEEIDD